jgi:hypothetical protein
MQVYEFKVLGESQGQAVIGISCDLCVSAYEISFLQCFIDGPDAAQQDGTASSVEEGYAMPLILRKLGVTGSRVVSSTISTSNATNHAAPSDSALSIPTVAAVSGAAVAVAVGIAVAIVVGLSVWKRRQIGDAISRISVTFVHPVESFPDGSVRPGHQDALDVEDIDEFGQVVAINDGQRRSSAALDESDLREMSSREWHAAPSPEKSLLKGHHSSFRKVKDVEDIDADSDSECRKAYNPFSVVDDAAKRCAAAPYSPPKQSSSVKTAWTAEEGDGK